MLSDLYSYLTKVASTSTLLSHNLLLLSLVVVELNITDIEFHFIFKNIICKELNSSTYKFSNIKFHMAIFIQKSHISTCHHGKTHMEFNIGNIEFTQNSIFKLSNSKRVVFCQFGNNAILLNISKISGILPFCLSDSLMGVDLLCGVVVIIEKERANRGEWVEGAFHLGFITVVSVHIDCKVWICFDAKPSH